MPRIAPEKGSCIRAERGFNEVDGAQAWLSRLLSEAEMSRKEDSAPTFC